MDSLGFDNPTTIRNQVSISSSIWSDHYDDFLISNENYSNTCEKLSFEEAPSSNLDLQGSLAYQPSSNFDPADETIKMLAPCILNSINDITSDLNCLQQQELIMLATHVSALKKSGISTTTDDAVSSQLHASVLHTTRPNNIINPLCCPSENFGSLDQVQVIDNIANNDEDLSAIFSSSKNTHRLSYTAAISSGESQNHGLLDCHIPNSDGLTSQNSFVPDIPDVESSKGKSSTQRKLEDYDKIGEKYYKGGGFEISFRNGSRRKKLRLEKNSRPSNINFSSEESHYELDTEAIAQVKEMIYRAAALRPVDLGVEEAMEKPKRKNVRISSDPQTVAARHRRERISERLRILQKLVPGGSKMDTATMLDEAANYVKFLKSQVRALETLGNWHDPMNSSTVPFALPLHQAFPMQNLVSTKNPNPKSEWQRAIPPQACP